MRRLGLFTALIFMLTGCGSRDAPMLTVAMSLGEEEWSVFREEIFPRFERRYDITVKAYQIESGQLAMKLEALQAARRPEIDLFAQDNMNLSVLVNRGLVIDLSAYERAIPAHVLPNLIESCKFNGRLMFMPFRPNVQIVYYNEDAFHKYGLTPPKSWNELLRVAKRFSREEGVGRILIKGFGGNSTATQVYEFILQAGGRPYVFNDAGCAAAFTFLRKLYPYLSAESKRAKWDTTNEILARKEAYLGQNWPFGVMLLVKKYGLSFIKTYSGWRGPDGEHHVIGGDVFGIPKGAQHKERALRFVAFIETKAIQELLVSRLGWPSIRDDAYGEVAVWLKPHFRSVTEALKKGSFREQVNWWPVYEKYSNEAFTEIVIKGAPVKPTLDALKNRLEKEKVRYRDQL